MGSVDPIDSECTWQIVGIKRFLRKPLGNDDLKCIYELAKNARCQPAAQIACDKDQRRLPRFISGDIA